MSVALNGPQGYEYQYVVTAFIAIRHAHDETAKIIVEKIDGEDAELSIEANSVTSIIEIQTKGTNKDLSLELLADWVLHFAERDADDFLLKRIKNDRNRIAVVATQARCLDETHKFAKPLSYQPHINKPLENREQREKFLSELRSKRTGTTSLSAKRAAAAGKIADELQESSALEDVTKRILIWESLEEGKLEARIQSELNRNYRIPQSQTDILLLRILAAVRAARDIHGDALPAIRKLLKKNAAESIFGENIFKDRQELSTLIKILDNKKILLLTGASLCGKSYTAKYFAQQYQDQGYSIFITDNPKEASRYLSDPINEDRLCLLEDPFGQIRLKMDADVVSLKRELSGMVGELRNHRRLIVTTRGDILIAAYAVASVADCHINGHEWVDLTVTDKSFLLSLWQEMATSRGIPEDIRGHIISNIEVATNATLLQPGQLKHLAREDLAKLQGKNASQLLRIAKVDVKDLGESWGNRGSVFRRLAIALVMTTNTIQKVHLPELSFVLSNSNDTPSLLLKEHHGVTMSLGLESDPLPAYPTYAATEKISPDYNEALDLLEAHGYIQRDGDSVLFGHPNYQAAFEYVTETLSESQFDELLSIASRGVSTLDPVIALNVVRSLSGLIGVNTLKPARKQKVLNILYAALQSIYPAVIDNALVVLLKSIDDLPDKTRDRVFQMVGHGINLDRICWHNGLCWLNYQPSINVSIEDGLYPSYTVSMERIKTAANALSDPDKIISVSSEEAWNILQAVERKAVVNDGNLLYQRLLAHKESFIRGKAAWILASRFSVSDPSIIERLLNDEQPSVAFQALRGCFACWNSYSEESKLGLTKALNLSLARPDIAISARKFLSDFGDDYGADHINRKDITPAQEKALWALWGSIFPSFLRSLPEKSIGINEPHLWDTTRKACEFILPEQGLEIAEAWFEWVNQKLMHSLPHDFGLGLAEFLINATKDNPGIRFELLKKLLAHADSHFLFVTIADMVDSWNDLTESERALMCSTIEGGRADSRWLKAAALTRGEVPTEIQALILGASITLSSDVDILLKTMDGKLLSDCLHVYCGTPQPLWWLGKHHTPSEAWRRLMIKLCEQPTHPLFELSLTEILTREQHAYPNDRIQVWATLCKTTDETLRDRLFEILLDCTLQGDVMSDYWSPLMESATEEQKFLYIDRVIENLSRIEYRDQEPWTVIGEYTFWDLVLPRLFSDKFILETILLFKSIPQSQDPGAGLNNQVKEKLILLINSIYDSSPPKLLMTHEMIRTWLEKEESSAAKALTGAASTARSSKFQQWRQELYIPEPHGLPDWNSVLVDEEKAG